MYLVVHTPTSLIIGALVSNPLLAFILAFFFHLGWDIVPHDHKIINSHASHSEKIKKMAWLAFIDLSFTLILLIILWQINKFDWRINLLAAVVGCVLPDILWGLNDLTNKKFKLLSKYGEFHNKVIHQMINKKVYIPIQWAVLIQLVVFVITIFVYLKIK